MELPIVYRDEYLIAINKPHGLLVHRTSIAADVKVFAMQCLRNQINQKVYLIHRLDRKTSGVLLFALDKATATAMNSAFRERKVLKTYKAIVRGWIPEKHGIIDYSLTNDEGKTQDAVTYYKCLKHIELPVPFGRYETSRYSIVEAYILRLDDSIRYENTLVTSDIQSSVTDLTDATSKINCGKRNGMSLI